MIRATATAAAVLAFCSFSGQPFAKAVAPHAPPGALSATPLLRHYVETVDLGDVWKRPGLSPRDRSLVTIAIIVAQGRSNEMRFHFEKALANGVTPRELSGAITQVGFYAGLGYATAASQIVAPIYREHGVKPADLAVSDQLRAIDKASDDQRAANVNRTVGAFAPDLAGYTNNFLFNDLWRRTDLAPRDRSLVTLASLAATGNAEQMSFHARLGKANGLTKAEMQELLIQLAFYAGWPKSLSALPVIQKAYEEPAR
jgi:4-carboxymuconolactone decarboxylase